jgi:hypothetical protein
VLLAAPLVLALLVGSWLLWARQEPSRQGGYCANATIEVTRVVSASVDLGAGATPPVQQILERVDEVDVRRFQVDTPDAIAPDVDLLATEGSPDAFARILVDYLERCGEPT